MNRKIFSLLFLPPLLLVSGAIRVSAQTNNKPLLEKLGFPRDAKLLIVHADDVGVTHSVNAATIKALDTGLVTSASIMVPCPWFPEIADYAKSHPDLDLGLHLTLTSERVYYRWGPVASKDKVPSLVDENGYFHHDWKPTTRINPKEVDLELHAQIDRAYAMGIRPTHLDSHQYRLFDNGQDLFEVVVRIAHEYHLPVFVARDWFAERPYLEKSLGPADIVIDHTITIAPGVAPDKWADFYKTALKNLKPGVTWGAAWRQRDFDFFTSQEFSQLLAAQNIKLITWREIAG